MTSTNLFAAAARFAGRVGNQTAASLLASAAAAACLAVPGLLNGPRAPAETALSTEPASWISPISPDGKIMDRHSPASGGDDLTRAATGSGLVTPAAILMPMNLVWADPKDEPRITLRVAAVQKAEPVQSPVRTAQALPPRRPQGLAERSHAAIEPMPAPRAEPLQLASATLDPEAVDAPRPPATILGRVVPSSVGALGSTVSGAVGLVGAAGSWTVARAASLVSGL